MRCRACNNILSTSELTITKDRGVIEDLCSSCLEVVVYMKYSKPQVDPVEEYVIYPPSNNRRGSSEDGQQ